MKADRLAYWREYNTRPENRARRNALRRAKYAAAPKTPRPPRAAPAPKGWLAYSLRRVQFLSDVADDIEYERALELAALWAL